MLSRIKQTYLVCAALRKNKITDISIRTPNRSPFFYGKCYFYTMLKKVLLSCMAVVGISLAETPTDLDSLFRGKEYKIQLNDSLRYKSQEAKASEEVEKKAKGKSWYVLQFEALADFDAAQRRRDQLVASTGYSIQVVFDTPFYKLRAGGWSTKSAAEDKARELSAYNISAFVVKVR